MKQVYKNPTFYYVVIPVIIGLWVLLSWTVSLPQAKSNWQEERSDYRAAQSVITEILQLDRERLNFADANKPAAEFDYARTAEKIASMFNIPASQYKLSSGRIITSGGQKSQSAKVTVKDVDVATFARFLSAIQLRWANLQCTKLKLTRQKGHPDKWDADLDLKYYF